MSKKIQQKRDIPDCFDMEDSTFQTHRRYLSLLKNLLPGHKHLLIHSDWKTSQNTELFSTEFSFFWQFFSLSFLSLLLLYQITSISLLFIILNPLPCSRLLKRTASRGYVDIIGKASLCVAGKFIERLNIRHGKGVQAKPSFFNI